MSRRGKKNPHTSRWAAYLVMVLMGITALALGIMWALWQAGYSLKDLAGGRTPAEARQTFTTPASPAPDVRPHTTGPDIPAPAVPEDPPPRPKEPSRPDREPVVPKPPEPRPSPRLSPRIQETGEPMVAIIIDDFGNNLNHVDDFLEMDVPITLAVLPQLPYSGKISWRARQKGRQVMLHLPLENFAGIDPGPGTINTSMDPVEVEKIFTANLDSVPGAVGFNNHEGSKATSDEELMEAIMSVASEKGLFFIDSVTASKSVAFNTARARGLSAGRRNIFLDNEDELEYICEQLRQLAETAQKEGRAIGIGHCRNNTRLAIEKMAPHFQDMGIRFVYASEVLQ